MFNCYTQFQYQLCCLLVFPLTLISGLCYESPVTSQVAKSMLVQMPALSLPFCVNLVPLTDHRERNNIGENQLLLLIHKGKHKGLAFKSFLA